MKKINLILPILVSLISFIVAHTGEEDYNYHMGMMSIYGAGWWPFGGLFMILIIVFLILLIVLLIKQIQK